MSNKHTKNLQLHPITAVLVSVSLFFGSQLVVGIVVSAVLTLMGWSETDISQWFMSGNVAQFMLSILVASTTIGFLAWYLTFKKIRLQEIGFIKPRLSDSKFIGVGALIYIISYITVVGILSSVIPSLDTEQTQDLGFATTHMPMELMLIFISLVVLPPLIEEIVVRGFMFTGLRQRLKFWPAALISSSIFGFAHLLGGEGGSTIWIATIDTFILGMVLAYLRDRSGSLWPAIGLHALKNFVAFTFLFILKG